MPSRELTTTSRRQLMQRYTADRANGIAGHRVRPPPTHDVANKARPQGSTTRRPLSMRSATSLPCSATSPTTTSDPSSSATPKDSVRVVLPRPSFDELLDAAISGPRRFGATDPDVLAHLRLLEAVVHRIPPRLIRTSATNCTACSAPSGCRTSTTPS